MFNITLNKNILIKSFCITALIILYFLTRYFHSFYLGAEGYGSGDAYRVILSAYRVGNSFEDVFMFSYLYNIFHTLTGISYHTLSFYFTPLIGLSIIIVIFDLVRKEFGFIQASFTSLIIILNPWLAYHSTEPSKEIFVILFLILSIYFLIRFEKTLLYRYLMLSITFFAIGITFYHSILVFLPFYIILLIYFIARNSSRPIHNSIVALVIMFCTFSLIAGPQMVMKQLYYKNTQSSKPVYLKTDVDSQGNVFQRQFGAMSYAILEDREKLGIYKLEEGIDTFILRQTEFKYLFIFILFVSIILFKKNKTYLPLIFCILTIYTFVIIGLQWTSYSHSSRYPQYILYFFLLCASIPIGWSIKLLQNRTMKIALLSLLISLVFYVFSPFTRIDIYRSIYKPHLLIGSSAVSSGIVINEDNQILYLGWPSVTLSLLENFNLTSDEYLHTFGWELVNLDGITSKDYITKNNIKYFIYNQSGSDYFDSNVKTYNLLSKKYKLSPIKYISEDKKSIVIYKIN
jgi:hypothetical protein